MRLQYELRSWVRLFSRPAHPGHSTATSMNPPRCTTEDYIQSLLATPKVCSATEAARVQPRRPAAEVPAPAHDAFTRLLHRSEPDPDASWVEVRPLLRTTGGVLVLDDSVL